MQLSLIFTEILQSGLLFLAKSLTNKSLLSWWRHIGYNRMYSDQVRYFFFFGSGTCPWDLTSVARGFFVFWIWKCEEVFQLPLESFERRPLHGIFMPTFQHDVVQGWRTTWRTLHSVAMFDLVQYFCVCHSWKKMGYDHVVRGREIHRNVLCDIDILMPNEQYDGMLCTGCLRSILVMEKDCLSFVIHGEIWNYYISKIWKWNYLFREIEK